MEPLIAAIAAVCCATIAGWSAVRVEKLRRQNARQHADAAVDREHNHLELQQQLTTLHAAMGQMSATFAEHAEAELGRYDRIMGHIVRMEEQHGTDHPRQ